MLGQGRTSQATPADTGRYVISDIIVLGNQRTRPAVILRELTFSRGDTLTRDALAEQVLISRNYLLNTGLFHEAKFSLVPQSGCSCLLIAVEVIERWYIIPVPALNLYDRNFNVWWVEHRRDLRWLQYGIRFYYKNLTGNNDELRLTALAGFQQNFSLLYQLPQLDERRHHSLRVYVSFTRSKRLAYGLSENRELIYQDLNSYQRMHVSTNADYQWRPAFNHRYTVSAGYRRYTITDTVAALNPDYAGDSATLLHYPFVKIGYIRDFRDVIAYPLRGSYQELWLMRMGLGMKGQLNGWAAQATAAVYGSRGRWYGAALARLRVSTPSDLPYLLQRSLGYSSDYVAGYEYYAINGTSFGYLKLSVKRPLLQWHLATNPTNILTRGARMPVFIYAKTFGETGLAWQQPVEPGNALANHLLLGCGVGLDIVLFYDTSLRLDYALNRKGEHGLFVHYSTYF